MSVIYDFCDIFSVQIGWLWTRVEMIWIWPDFMIPTFMWVSLHLIILNIYSWHLNNLQAQNPQYYPLNPLSWSNTRKWDQVCKNSQFIATNEINALYNKEWNNWQASQVTVTSLTADWPAGSVGCVLINFIFWERTRGSSTLGIFLPDVRITQSGVFFAF